MRERIGLVLGPVVFVLFVAFPPPAGIAPAAWRTAAVAALMAVWWVTEAVPIAVTSLVPLVLFPLTGIASMDAAAAPYANPVIFLFLGGFLVAAGLERSGLHKRIAFHVIRVVGTAPRQLLFGFMLATGLLSAGVSNTATVALMLPMAASVLRLVEGRGEGEESAELGPALMLGLAYAASLGGLATLIGTPPNALLAGFMAETYGRTIGFAQWMLLGVPLAAVSIPLCWLVLTRLHRLPRREIAGGRELIRREIASLGRIDRAEGTVAVVTVGVALAWMFRPLLDDVVPGLSDPGIAVLGALLLFLIPIQRTPVKSVLTLPDLEAVPWSVLLLFGGGLSLASAIESSGLARAIGDAMAMLGGVPAWVAVAVVTVVVILLTELTSNTATAATFLPIVGSAAIGMGLDPATLAVPAALAASCAFMLPVATPPNAIVFGSGKITIGQMVRAGIWMNAVMTIVIILAVHLLARFVLD
ncbi:MAG: SLC13 family permease [Thermoanaerobaculia bacterium]